MVLTILRFSFPPYSLWGSPVGLHAGILGSCQLMAPIYCSLLPYWEAWIIKSGSGRALTAGGGGETSHRAWELSLPSQPALSSLLSRSWLLQGVNILVCSYSLHFCGPSATISFVFENLLLVQPWARCWNNPKKHLWIHACSQWAYTKVGRICAAQENYHIAGHGKVREVYSASSRNWEAIVKY